MNIDLRFPHDYEVVPDAELPAGPSEGQLFEFGIGSSSAARTRCLVRVQLPSGKSWIGRFVGEYDEPPAISLVASSPDAKKVCVISAGTGYLVDVDRPDQFDLVDCFPICAVRAIAAEGLIVFGSFTGLVAYGRTGLSWKATGLVSDELQIVDVDGRLLAVEGLEAATGQTIHLAIDVLTGKLERSSSGAS